MASHRYWRWVNLHIPGAYFETSELRLLAGSTPLAATMTSSVDTQTWPGTQGLLADGNQYTRAYWTSAEAEDSGFWVQADLGTAQDVTGMRMTAYDTSDRYPSDITLQWSDDGSTWTTFGAWSGMSYPGNNTAGPVLEPSATWRFWRLHVTANDGSSYVSFGEIELLNYTTDLTTGLGANCTQAGDGAVGGPAAGVDDAWSSSSTECGSTWSGGPWWWQIDLGAPQSVTSMTLRAQRTVTGRTPTAFALQGAASSTGPWTDVITVTGATDWAPEELRSFAPAIPADTYIVAGTIRVSGVVLTSPRRVRVHRRSDGELLGETDSVDGAFSVNLGSVSDEVYIIPIDLDSGATDWAPPCANRVVPVLAA